MPVLKKKYHKTSLDNSSRSIFKLSIDKGSINRHSTTKRTKRENREREREHERKRDYVKNSSERVFVGP